MAVFKFVVSNPETRKSYNLEMDQDKVLGLLGKRIGEKFNGDILGLSGYELQITGGTDKDGFPMNPSVHGSVRRKIVISGPPGFHPKLKGQRRRKTVRGNTLSKDIVQVNCKIVKVGKKAIGDILGKAPEEKAEPAEKEEKAEKPKEAPKEEPKKEEKAENKEAPKEEKLKEKEKPKPEVKEEPKEEAPAEEAKEEKPEEKPEKKEPEPEKPKEEKKDEAKEEKK